MKCPMRKETHLVTRIELDAYKRRTERGVGYEEFKDCIEAECAWWIEDATWPGGCAVALSEFGLQKIVLSLDAATIMKHSTGLR